MKNPYQQAVSQYKAIELETQVENASPHQLVNMLFQGARTNIAAAQGFISHQRIQEKCESITKAINIIDGLRTSLDHEQGGEIAGNLDRLYEYIQEILLKANLHNDSALLDEANALIAEIHQAWQQIQV
ncbi:flagellar export chaperone FliS [Legionella dresdenensis]|uniref:Flagellar secretion chaperone FliS n=1 Tax=Legionella dresdenensis TaxID=450200 RepID=A0ABV8CCA4_9GAMM